MKKIWFRWLVMFCDHFLDSDRRPWEIFTRVRFYAGQEEIDIWHEIDRNYLHYQHSWWNKCQNNLISSTFWIQLYTPFVFRGYIIPRMDVNCSGVQCAMVSTYLSPRPLGEWWLRKWGISFQATSHLHHCLSTFIIGRVKATDVLLNFLIYMCNGSEYQLPRKRSPQIFVTHNIESRK